MELGSKGRVRGQRWSWVARGRVRGQRWSLGVRGGVRGLMRQNIILYCHYVNNSLGACAWLYNYARIWPLHHFFASSRLAECQNNETKLTRLPF